MWRIIFRSKDYYDAALKKFEGSLLWKEIIRKEEWMIKKLRVKNFKSLRDIEIELGNFNVLIGPNASGKSNLLDSLAFLSENLYEKEIMTTFDVRGGFEGLVFGGKEEERIEIFIDFLLDEEPSSYLLSFDERTIKEEKLIIGEKVIAESNFYKAEAKQKVLRNGTLRDIGTWGFSQSLIPYFNHPKEYPLIHRFYTYLSSWKSYGFITQEMRKTLTAEGIFELEKSGGNLAQVLLSLHSEHPKIFSKVEEMLRQGIPEIEELLTPLPLGKNETFIAVRERGFDQRFDYHQLSDGTLKLLAYITAVALPEPKLLCFEEPENFIHPHLLELLVEILRKSEKQIILATHSPYFVDLVGTEDIVVVEKKEGETVAQRIKEPEKLKEKLKELGLGLGEYWYSSAIGGVP